MCYARLPWRFGRAPSVSAVRPVSAIQSDVTAESVYEAAALGLSALRKSGWADGVALGTELEIQVREPPTSHRVTLHQIHRWCDGIATSPDETLKKRKLKQLLG